MGGDEGVGFSLGEPFEEGGLISGLKPPYSFGDFVEWFARGRLGLEEGGGESAREEGVDGVG